MPLKRILTLVAAWLSIASAATAQGWEIGPRVGLSMPTGRFKVSADPGLNVGVTAIHMTGSRVGFVCDLGYQRWPGSRSANASFDEVFSALSGASITGSAVTWSAFQATAHVRALARVSRDLAPWVQVGAGGYRVVNHLKLPADQLQAAGWQGVTSTSDAVAYRFGYVGGIGLDVPSSPNMTFGVDASYHYLMWKDASGANLTVFTVGLHVARQLR